MTRGWVTGSLAGGAVLLTGFTTLRAQSAAPATGRVGCVQVVKVFNEYRRQVDLNEEFQQIRTQLDAENTTRRQRIETLQAAMTAMDPQDPLFPGKREELLKLQINYKNWADLMQAQMAREVATWSGRVYEEILAVTNEVARQNGIDLVVNLDTPFVPSLDNPEAVREQIYARRVLFAANPVDFTQTVLDTLNARYTAEGRRPMMKVEQSITP